MPNNPLKSVRFHLPFKETADFFFCLLSFNNRDGLARLTHLCRNPSEIFREVFFTLTSPSCRPSAHIPMPDKVSPHTLMSQKAEMAESPPAVRGRPSFHLLNGTHFYGAFTPSLKPQAALSWPYFSCALFPYHTV